MAPNIGVTGSTRNGYYIGDVNVTITDPSSASRAVKTRFKRTTSSGEEELTLSNKQASFQIKTDGTYNISAWLRDTRKQ